MLTINPAAIRVACMNRRRSGLNVGIVSKLIGADYTSSSKN